MKAVKSCTLLPRIMASTTNQRQSTQLRINPPSYTADDAPKSAVTAKRVTLQPKTRTTLQELWWKAEQEFNKENPEHSLGAQIRSDNQGLQIAKDGLLDRWQQRYRPDTSEDAKRKQRITRYMTNSLNALELVGSFASQAAASAFPPAAICFSALQFLIDAPKHIQKVYEDLEKLFIQVDRFLMQFSIYQRMDDKFGLDEALITNANKLLIQFVRICGLSTRLLEGGRWQTIKQGFKTVLFSDDGGVQAELDSFESLAKFNNELTHTITLEHVLESEENTKKILRDNGELLTGVGQLLANSNDEKMKFANKDRVQAIRKSLFDGKGPADEEMSAGVFDDDIVPNTFETIETTSEYQTWDQDETNSTLVIWGSSGSGKSRFMDAIKQHLDNARNNAERDRRSIYVAAFNFSEKISKTTGRKKFGKSLVPHALRVLAFQVAEQSTTYAKDLFLQLETNKIKTNDDDHESVWKSLRLAKLNISPSPRLYILLDAVDAELEDARTLMKLLGDQREIAALRIKVLLTTARAEDGADMLTHNYSLAISAADIKAKLLPSFVRSKMIEMGIFQDPEKSSRLLRQKVFEGVVQPHVTFRNAAEKLSKIKAAIEDSAPRSIITDILDERSIGSTAQEGQSIMTSLETSLNSGDIALLSSILMWLIGSDGTCLTLETLEAALRFEKADLPIEPLAKKIKSTFSKAIAWRSNDVVELQPGVEAFLTARHEHLQLQGNEPLITMEISIRDATPSAVTQFVWNLHESLTNGKFEFDATNTKGRRIQVSKLSTHMTIISLCFKILSEGWTDDTEEMMWYAQWEVPRQLVLLQEMQRNVRKSDRKLIGEGLISFLRDPQAFEDHHQRYSDIRSWCSDEDKLNAFRFWLEDEETVQQLPIKEQRWIREVMKAENGKLGFLCDLVQSICKRWLTDRKSPSWDLAQWLYDYLDLEKKADTQEEEEQGETQEEAEQGEEEDGEQKDEQAEKEEEEEWKDDNGDELKEVDQEITHERESQGDETCGEALKDGDASRQEGYETTSSDDEITVGVIELKTDDPKDIVPDREKEDMFSYDNVESGLNELVRKYYEPEKNAVYYHAWGRTCLEDLYPTRAIKNFRKALNLARAEADDESQILVGHVVGGLARCKQSLQNNEAALELASQSLATFEQLNSNGKLDDVFDKKNYVSELKYWASISEKENPARALQWYEKAYLLSEHEEERVSYRWAVLKLRCHVDESQEAAVEFLEDWFRDHDRSDDSSPALSVLDMVERDDDWDTLLQVSCSVRNEKLRTRLLALCAQALRFAGRGQTYIHGRLSWMQANICVTSTVPRIRTQALFMFESALTLYSQDPQNENFWQAIPALAVSVMKYKFDFLMFDANTDGLASQQDKLQKKKQLERDFETISAIHQYLRYDKDINTAASYIISFCSLNDMLNEARVFWKDQMASALEILSDSDPDNDREGAKILARIFCFLGDIPGLLTAFSLVDRPINLKLLHCAEDGDKTISLEERINNGWLHSCDGCKKALYSSGDTGIWWCRYCPNVDLCSDCKTKHDTGVLKMRLCNPAHSSAFLHLVHVDYSSEELESGNDEPKVLVDWTHEAKSSVRGGYSRGGGSVVTLKQWVERLRKEWDLPEPTGDLSRAQK